MTPKKSHLFDPPRFINTFPILILLPLLLFQAYQVRAQTPPPASGASPVSLQASAAFNGNIKYGEWLPVWVEVKNDGPDMQARVSIRVFSGGGAMTFVAPLELPAGSHKRLPVYILPNNFSHQLVVDLLSGDKVLASQDITIQPQANVSYLVGLLASQRGSLSLIDAANLPGMTRPKVIVDLPLSDVPERAQGLNSFDLLVLNDIDTSTITPDQVKALESWVRQGGRLVVGGGAGAAKTAAGLPPSLLPLTLQRTVEIQNLSALSSFVSQANPVRVPGPFVAAVGQSPTGKVLAAQSEDPAGEFPLVIEWPVGAGYVDFVALDLTASPFDAWNGTIGFWEKLLAPGAAYPDWMPPDVSARQQLASQMPYTLSNLPMLDLPSVQSLALLLGLYILMVGPLNYLLLRWQKRLHLAWITIPLITIVFSAAAFGLGFALHGSDIFVNKIAIFQVLQDGKASVDTFVGLFSPAQSSYELKVAGGGLLSPLSPYSDPWNSSNSTPGMSLKEMVLIQGDPGTVSGLSVEQWSMQSFMDEGMSVDFGTVTGDLRLEGSALVGSIHNSSQYTIKDAALIMGKSFQHLGDLPAGGDAQVNLDLSNMAQPSNGPSLSYRLFDAVLNKPSANGADRQAEVKRSIVESIFERTPAPVKLNASPAQNKAISIANTPVLIGWLDKAPPDVSISGKQPAQQATAIVLAPLSYSLPESGSVSLPVGFIPGMLSKMPTEGGACGETGATAAYISKGEAIFEFSMPAIIKDIRAQNLKLSIQTDSGAFNPPPVVDIYNWQTQSWVTLNGLSSGANLVPNAASLISKDGIVQVRLAPPENSQGCYYLALGMEGQRP